MNQKLSYFLFLFLCFPLITFLNAQTQNDSLAKYSYEELHALIDSTKYDKQELSKIYASAYLKRAKKDEDKIKISRGYFYLTHYYYDKDVDLAIKYTDSIIGICKDCQNEKYPALGYYFKGYLLYQNNKFENALDNFLHALKYLKKKKNLALELNVRNAIIALKNNWVSNEEILKYRIELLDFIVNNKESFLNFKETHIIALNNLSIAYLRNRKYIEGMKIAKKGIRESIKYKDTIQYYSFISLTGTVHYYLKNYEATIDSLQKVLPYQKGHKEVMNNYYLAKSYDKLNQPEKAHFHFLKTDSIYQVTKDIFPEMRNAYEHIIDYYKSKNDVENQIKYYDRLLETDKIIDSTYTYVKETVQKKYETPQAIAERNRLLEEAQAKESSWKYSFGIISAILLLISGVLFYAFRRQKYYKKRFENLMSKNSGKEKSISTALDVTQGKNTSTVLHKTSEKQKQQGNDIGISETIVKSILKGLAEFEASEGFRKQVALTELAKDLKTNPKYLSKVINWHYEKNFTSYINELRVEYVVSKLKSDSKFRNYTIKAIAKEAGFGNAESFSKTFYKVTGIYPSYFIKELNKRIEDS